MEKGSESVEIRVVVVVLAVGARGDGHVVFVVAVLQILGACKRRGHGMPRWG